MYCVVQWLRRQSRDGGFGGSIPDECNFFTQKKFNTYKKYQILNICYQVLRGPVVKASVS